MIWGKHTIFERSLNSALIIKAPGRTGEKSVNKVVSTIDIYSTIIELCGVEMPQQADGRSLVPLLNSSKQNWEESSFGYFRNGISLRTDQYRLTKYFRKQQPIIELYDHKTDPNGIQNIAEGNSDIVERLMPIWEKGNTGLY